MGLDGYVDLVVALVFDGVGGLVDATQPHLAVGP